MNSLEATPDDLRHGYRLLLGREPDAEGLAMHRRLIHERKVSTDELGQLFLASDEFHSKWQSQKVSLPGYSLFVSPADRDVSATIAAGQSYEPYVESILRGVLKPGDTFLDVGANIGYFTALAAYLVGPTGHVIAWEPLDKNLQLIYATLWENRFENVTVFPFAASSEQRLVAMGSHTFSSNAGIVNRVMGQQRTRFISQSHRLDDQLSATMRIDVVKFDIEGHEIHAWRGGAKLLAKHRPHVLTEFHPKCIRENTDLDPAEYVRILLDYSGVVEVLHRERSNVLCRDVESVLREWQSADDAFRMNGAMHIDLYARAPAR
jgi:FkbM family methyltransferase